MSIFSCSVHKKKVSVAPCLDVRKLEKFKSEGSYGDTLVCILPHPRVTSDLGQHAQRLVQMSSVSNCGDFTNSHVTFSNT